MAVYSVSYDLHKGQRSDYALLFKALQRFPAWFHPLESTWFVVTGWTSQQVSDFLRRHLDLKDKLLVTEVTRMSGWTSMGISQKGRDWLHKHLKTVPRKKRA